MSKKKRVPLTPKDLYDFAKLNGAENKPLHLLYFCDDDWYNYDGTIPKNIYLDKESGKIILRINN